MKVSKLIEELQKAQKDIPELGDAEVKLGIDEIDLVGIAGVNRKDKQDKNILLLDAQNTMKIMAIQLLNN